MGGAGSQSAPDRGCFESRGTSQLYRGCPYAVAGTTHFLMVPVYGTKTNMTRVHGRSPRGQPCRAAVPYEHWKTRTFVAALRADAITAPFVFSGATNADIFRQYARDMLAPTLQPSDVVVMDNLYAHKNQIIRELTEARGATLRYLPAYSPDLNPIELVFAKLKRLLRSAKARTVDRLWTTLGECLQRFSPAECAKYLRHCGYGQTM